MDGKNLGRTSANKPLNTDHQGPREIPGKIPGTQY